MKSEHHKLKAVLFDLGGTLVKTSNENIPHIMKRILNHYGITRSVEEISKAWQEAEKELDFRDLTKLLDEFWVQWNEKILRHLEVKSNIETLPEFIATHWWDYSNVSLYPDAEKILPLLKERDLKIGVITNGLQSDIDEILPKVDLQDFFHIVVVINTLRKMKPDKEAFQYALRELKTAPSEAIFIGDEIEADYKGAKKAGITPYLIDRDGNIEDENVNKLSSLEDLFGLNIIK